MWFTTFLGAFLVLLAGTAWSQEVSPTETDPVKIMKSVEAREQGDRTKSVLNLEVRDSKGRTRSRTVVSWSKDFADGRKQLMIFQQPADVAGTGLLSIDYDLGSKEDDQWLYLPSLKKSTRISSGEKSGSFMGTDLTYSDMTKTDPNDFNYTIKKQSAMVGEEECWVIEARPKTQRVQNETGYQKSRVWISKSKLLAVQMKAWVIEGRKIKYIRFDDLKQVDGVWVAHKISARTKRNKKTESTTVLSFSSYLLNQPEVTDALFTQQKLQEGL